MEQLGDELAWAHDKLERCKREISDKGLRINKDGTVSRRSRYGQEVQGAIDNANKIIEEKSDMFDRLYNLPMIRWKSARKHCSKIVGGVCSVCVWLFMIFVTSQSSFSDFDGYVDGIGNTASEGTAMLVDIWSGGDKKSKEQENASDKDGLKMTETPFAKALFKAMVFMTIVYFIAKTIGGLVFWARHHKPSLDASNIQ